MAPARRRVRRCGVSSRGGPHHREPSLRVNIVWTLAGNAAYVASQWGVLVLLAKLGTAEMVGVFVLGLAICGPIQILANLDLRAVLATDARREFPFGDYVRLRAATCAAGLLAIGAVAAALSYPVTTSLIVLAVGVAKTVESLSDILYGRFQQHERLELVARSLVLRGGLSLAGVAAGLLLGRSLLGATLLMGVGWAGVLLAHDLPASRRLAGGEPAPASWRRVRRLAWLALPTGLATAITSLTINVPRYAVERVLGLGPLGIFAALAYFIPAADAVGTAVGAASAPRIAGMFARRDPAGLQRLLVRLVGGAAVLALAGWTVVAVGGRRLLGLLYTPEYAAHADVFTLLLAAAGLAFASAPLGQAVLSGRRLRPLVPATLGVLLLTVVASAVLVPRWGLVGAAWATLASYVAQAAWKLVLTRLAQRRLRAEAAPSECPAA